MHLENKYPTKIDYGLTLEQALDSAAANLRQPLEHPDDLAHLQNMYLPVPGAPSVLWADVTLVPVGDFVYVTEVTNELDRRGLRPAGLPELLAWIAQHNPTILEGGDEFTYEDIAEGGFVGMFYAIGAVASHGDDDQPTTVILETDEDYRVISFVSLGGWKPGSYFLAVPKVA